MTYEGKWLLPGVLYDQSFYGLLEPEDVERSRNKFNNEIRDLRGQTLIHMLVDVSATTNLLNPKSVVSATKSHPPARMGWVLVITGSDAVLQKVGGMIISMLSQMLKFRFRTFGTREEALSFLAGVDDQVKAWLE
jgi:hypothetical protein